ncbi:FAD-dependent monooxygenase [Streptosporangium sp. NPDC001681]|uniref:FAD-dependent monooxygenase n=1 Tax=Streptosporangium sp. NPDC001681 TaxID=3154395 RepID=UPI00332BD975
MKATAVIVGAGIGGLATAIGLRMAGWEVTVLERWPRIVSAGTALGIRPDAQAALDRLGLGEELRRRTVPYRDALIRAPHGRHLADLPLRRIERRGGSPVLMISRVSLMEMLLRAVGETTIRTGTQITDPVTLHEEHALVVGADGLRSAVRAAYFDAAPRPRYSGIVAWRGVTGFEPPSFGETWGPGQVFGITPQEPGSTNWYAAVATPQGRRESLDELRARFAGWHDPIPRVLAEAGEETVLRHEIHDLSPRLRSFVTGNVALVGDAAHAMTPSLGQGACQALLDAAALADLLAAPRTPADVAIALRAYDARRRRPAQRLVTMSRWMTRLAGTGRLSGARNALLRVLPG